MRLIITRPMEDARPLAAKLERMGHQAIVAPLLSIRRREPLFVPDRAYQAVMITSANGARALAGTDAMARLEKARAFAVGSASAMAAYDAGFLSVVEAEGDVAALSKSVRELLAPQAGPLLYVSGAVTAGDLEGTVKSAGFEVDRVVAYDAVPADTLQDECLDALRRGSANGVLLFSPRSARIWTELVSSAGAQRAAQALVHFCLSGAVAAELTRAWGEGLSLRVPERPHESALLDLVEAAA